MFRAVTAGADCGIVLPQSGRYQVVSFSKCQRSVRRSRLVTIRPVSAGKAGAKNAALLAISILALGNPELGAKLKEFRAAQQRKVEEADASLQKEIAKLSE